MRACISVSQESYIITSRWMEFR